MRAADSVPVKLSYETGPDAILIAAVDAPDRFVAAVAARVDPVLLVERLPQIVDWATASDASLVVAMRPDQIDAVAATMLGGRSALLVDPSVGDCVGAIVIAAEQARKPAGVFDVGRETDGSRFERLNVEVARIAEALARLTRAEQEEPPRPPAVGDRTTRYGLAPSTAEPSAEDVRRAIRARAEKDRHHAREAEAREFECLAHRSASQIEVNAPAVATHDVPAGVPARLALLDLAPVLLADFIEESLIQA